MGLDVLAGNITDFLDRVLESIDLADYKTLMITSSTSWYPFKPSDKKSATVLLTYSSQRSNEDVYVITLPALSKGVWVSVTPEDLGQSFINLRSLMTSDLETVVVVNPATVEEKAATYYTMKSLRAVNSEAKILLVIGLDPEWGLLKKLNMLTLIASLIRDAVVNEVILVALNTLEKYFTSDKVWEIRKWCFSNFRDVLKGRPREGGGPRILQISCLSFEAPNVFKDLAGIIEFTKFVNWGESFRSRKSYVIAKGPKRFLGEGEFSWAAKKEGWISYEPYILGNDENLFWIGIAEEWTSYLVNLLDEASRFFLAERKFYRDMSTYTRIYTVLKSFEGIVERLGGVTR